MKSIVIGTAGHIDHGKTALVKALTGIDADRLEEEKRRGITIDLGFAHMDLKMPDGQELRLGFVDVPGHERFVRNMLAGVGGIDLVLLVIAADESIKPQTREHFDILQLIGVKRGITVLTKADAVDEETLDVARLEAEEFLRGSFLEPPRAPVVAVSSKTGAGLEDLKRAIAAAAAEVPARDTEAMARLPIDRVFSMKGFGTVITGTLISGTIHKDEELQVFPSGDRVRVRGVQVHGQESEKAAAGQRTALNLAGARTADLARGMSLAPPDTFAAASTLDVRLRLLAGAPRALKDRSHVHFHAGTMETAAEIVLDGVTEAARATEVFARLKLADPALLLPGDRFIIRQFSPVVTIGGGIVLDARPVSRTFRQNRDLEIFAEGDSAAILQARIARRFDKGTDLTELVKETGWTRSRIESWLASAIAGGEIIRAGETLLVSSALEALRKQILPALEEFHRRNPLVSGINKEELRVQTGAGGVVFQAILERLEQEKKIEVSGELVRLTGRGVVMKDEEAESKKKIEDAFAAAALRVPALHEVIAGLRIDKVRAQKIVTLLLREKVLTKISDELVFHRSALEELRRQMAAQKEKSPTIDVATFKELTGVSRKYAIPLLEYLDRERVTRRVGDARQIL
ncbi:MAG TPA: selenocysteine-specific translation elongation factor [Candidatus Sulfotelmatobacter sp.]|nr:selenocysteine-specific translation elongation factor [Candidatus Sulfotelmatobacter sp.]